MKRRTNPAELLLINPRPGRNSKGRFTKRHTSRTQHAAFIGGPRRRKGKKRRSTLQSVRFHGHQANRSAFHAAGYARNSRRRRRNPSFSSKGFIGLMGTGLAGALGGVLIDLAMKPVPLAIKAGPLNHLVRAGGAVGLGLLASMFRIPGAEHVARGALAITAYNAARQYVTVPMGLGEMSDDDVAAIHALNPNLTYDDGGMSDGMSAYLPTSVPGTGFGEEQLEDLGLYADVE